MRLLSFILPVRIDNEDRWSNLLTSVRYLSQTFPESEIILIEDALVSKCEALSKESRICYSFKENSGRFCRSVAINTGLMMATRKHVVVYDIDVLIAKTQIAKATRVLEKGNKFIVLPHNTIFVNVSGNLKNQLIKDLTIEIVPQFRTLHFTRHHKDVSAYPIPSGVVMFNRDLLIKIGGFNKKMVSYGWEDIEVLKRAAILGMYCFGFYCGNIVHLDHQRGSDSVQNEYFEANRMEFLHTSSMTADTLIEYIRTDLALDSENIINQSDMNFIRKSNIRNFNFFRFVINKIMLKIFSMKLK